MVFSSLLLVACGPAADPQVSSQTEEKQDSRSTNAAAAPTREAKALVAGSTLPADTFGVPEEVVKEPEPELFTGMEGVALEAAVKGLSPQEFESALADLLAKPAGVRRDTLLVAFGVAMADSEPKRAMELLLGLGNTDEVSRGVLKVATSWGDKDPAAGIEFASSIENRETRDRFLQGVVDGWSLRDPAEAFYNLAVMPNNELGAYLSIAATHYAKLDLAGAVEESLAVEDRRNRSLALRAVFGEWSANNPAEAFEFATQDGQNILREVGYEIATAWAAKDRKAALEAASGMERGRETSMFMRGLLQGLDGDTAMSLLQDPLVSQNPSLKLMAVSQASRELARSDAQEGIAWAATLTNPSERAAAYRSVGSEFVRQDPVEARRWVDQLPAGVDRDGAVTGILWSQARSQPEQAAALATTISSEQDRNRSLSAILRVWKQRDATAAEAWATSSGQKALYDNVR